jgi:hypothetical protein
VPFPNPNPRSIAIQLAGPAQRVTLKVYTPAWVLVGVSESGPLAKGWVRLPLPKALFQAASGLYYFTVRADDGGRFSPALKGRFYRLP